MPGSDSANNSWVMQKLKEIEPKRILDVGAGNGNFGQRVKSVFGHYPQGAEFGNPFEIHHEEDWNTARILEAFPGIIDHKEFPITGAYFAKFEN
jgi:hypothetical protein